MATFVLPEILLAEGAAGPAGALGGMWPILAMFAVFYFLVIRPMSKQEKDRKARLAELKRGDRIVLTGGVLGRVSKVEGPVAVVEIADKVKIRVLTKDIADFEDNALKPDAKDKDKDKDAKKDDGKDAKKDDDKDADDDKSSRRAG